MRIEGPLVAEIHRFALAQLGATARSGALAHAAGDAAARPARAEALFVTRDNRHHRDDIERHYRVAIRAARQRRASSPTPTSSPATGC